jgi:hypothetical protein
MICWRQSEQKELGFFNGEISTLSLAVDPVSYIPKLEQEDSLYVQLARSTSPNLFLPN